MLTLFIRKSNRTSKKKQVVSIYNLIHISTDPNSMYLCMPCMLGRKAITYFMSKACSKLDKNKNFCLQWQVHSTSYSWTPHSCSNSCVAGSIDRAARIFAFGIFVTVTPKAGRREPTGQKSSCFELQNGAFLTHLRARGGPRQAGTRTARTN